MSVVGFVAKYADEALAIGKALTSLLEGVAISPAQAAEVQETIKKLNEAHKNITEILDKAPEKVTVKINKKDIDNAVKAVLPDLVAAEVAKAMATKK